MGFYQYLRQIWNQYQTTKVESRVLKTPNLQLKGQAFYTDISHRGEQEIYTHFKVYRRGKPLRSIGEINIRYKGIGFPQGEPRPQIGYLFKNKKYGKQYSIEALRETLRYVLKEKNYSKAFIHVAQGQVNAPRALGLQKAISNNGDTVYPPETNSEPYGISYERNIPELLNIQKLTQPQQRISRPKNPIQEWER